jgi:hypothetical protein
MPLCEPYPPIDPAGVRAMVVLGPTTFAVGIVEMQRRNVMSHSSILTRGGAKFAGDRDLLRGDADVTLWAANKNARQQPSMSFR